MIDMLAGTDHQGLELARHAAVGIGGLGALAVVGAAIAAVAYRRGTMRRIPIGAAVFVGLAPGAVWTVLTTVWIGVPIRGAVAATPANASYVVASMTVGATVAVGGRRLGDRIACEVYGVTPIDRRDDPGSLVASARTTVAVDLPETVGTLAGYRPVDRSTGRALAGRTIRFPRRYSTDALEPRLERRLERDFGIDHVDASLAEDGSVASLEAGRRPAGLGPTLPPETVAVAIRADPPSGAAPGDPVEVWDDADASRLVATGTLRSTAGDVATIVIDETDAENFGVGGDAHPSSADTDGSVHERSSAGTDGGDADRSPVDSVPGNSFRVVTRAEQPSGAPRLLSALRGATESISSVTVTSDGRFDGEFVGWLPGTVLVIDRDGDRLPFPDDSETLRAGDRVWVLGAPDEIRRFEAGELAESTSADVPSAEGTPVEDASAGPG